MTDDQIIAVAKAVRNGGHWDQLDIINFGRLIAAAERERIGDQCAEQIKAAIEDEREACLALVKEYGKGYIITAKPVAIALHTGTKQGIKWICRVDDGTHLYTHPPRRDWQGLTDAELREAYMAVSGNEWCLGGMANAESFYEVIEANLKELNHE